MTGQEPLKVVEPLREAVLEHLLNEGLNLCVRARWLDKMDKAQAESDVRGGLTKSFTAQLWVLEQYDKDLEAWEQKTRAILSTLQHQEKNQ